MNPRKLFLPNLLAIALLASCTDETARQRIAQLDQKVTEQDSKLREAIDRNGRMTEELGTLEAKLRSVFQMQSVEPSLFRSQDPFALIDPHQKGFASVQTTNGSLLVSILNIEPHLDGFKVSLQIGNPYNMTYSGFSVSMRCGSPPPKYPRSTGDGAKLAKESLNWIEQYVSWKDTLKTKSTSYTDQLPSGKWSKIEFMLAPVTNADLAFMQIAITTNQVNLLPTDP